MRLQNITVGITWDYKKITLGIVRLQKNYPWDYVRLQKNYPWDCIAITKIVGDYKYFTFGLQQDYTITVGLHLCSKDLFHKGEFL